MRSTAGFAVFVAALTLLAISAGQARAAATSIGFTAEPYAKFGAEGSNAGAATGQKPESKLWYQGGSWWASMVSNAHNGAHTIHRLDGTTWTDTGVVVDSRPTAREDVLLAGTTLYVLVRAAPGTGSSKLARFTYSNGSGTYTPDSGFPVSVAGGGAETETLARDGNGTLWLTYAYNRSVYVSHSQGSDASWITPYIVPGGTNLSSDDISAIVAFDDGHGAAVGVMWSNQNDAKQHFAVHRAGQGDGTWTQETALSGTGEADDHINLKTYAGRVFAVVKTSQDDGGGTGSTPLIKLLVRSTSGSWSNYRVATISEDNTRPITMLEIDPADQKLYVFMTLGVGATAHGIAYKQTFVSNINFPSTSTVFIQGSNGEVINDATSTKQNADDTSGIVVMASDGARYWWNRLSTGGSTNTPPTATAGSASTAVNTPVTVTLRGSDFDAADCELQFSIAAGPSHGTLGTPSNLPCQAGNPNNDSATVQYTPAGGYTGADSFTFRVSDGTASATANVSITVSGSPPPTGSIAFHAASSAGNTSTTSLTISAPSGAQAGDVEVAAVDVRGNPSLTAPTGWTLVRSDQNGNLVRQAVYSHVVGSSEPSSYTWSWNFNAGASGGIVAYGNVDTANPVNAVGGTIGSASTITAPSVTTTVSGAMLLGFFGTSAPATFTPPGGMTERFDDFAKSGTYLAATEGAEQLLGAAGSTGSRTATASYAAGSVGQLVALTPGSGSPPPPGNTPPTATAGSATTTKNTAVTITLRGTDPDSGNCELGFSITAQPAHGTLGAISNQACQAGRPNSDTATVQYTPATGYTGPDSLTFQVSDGTAASTANVSITVNDVPPSGGGIAFRAASSAGNASTTSLTIPAPAGVQPGDVELAVVDDRGSQALGVPSGWTLVRSDQSGYTIKQDVYVHVAGASEPASYTWSYGTAAGASGGIVAYSGVDTASPINASSGTTGSGTTVTAPSVTTTVASTMLVGFFGTAVPATFTAPAGMSERFDAFATAGTYRAATEGADQLLGAAGATGTRSATASLGSTTVAQLVALKPA
jgi:hypothetical protein